jgi:tRNA (guanine37-N1)-methyltransferase
MQFDILTLFPEIIETYGNMSILGRAQKNNLIKILAHNFREYAHDKRGHVDDRPYGGGPGMILQVQPIFDCLKKIGVIKVEAKKTIVLKKSDIKKQKNTKIILLDPAGKKFDQRMAEKFSKLDRLVFICGRYEGFDARIHTLVDERISIGDYVIAGGELPALTIVEAAARLIPGVLGNEESLKEETFGRLQNLGLKLQRKIKSEDQYEKSSKEYPQYTRPENFMGLKVPKILLSGDHKKIAEWRKNKKK